MFRLPRVLLRREMKNLSSALNELKFDGILLLSRQVDVFLDKRKLKIRVENLICYLVVMPDNRLAGKWPIIARCRLISDHQLIPGNDAVKDWPRAR